MHSTFPIPWVQRRNQSCDVCSQPSDRVVRGEFTRREVLQKGQMDIDIRTLVLSGLLLGVVYGVFMGLFGVLRSENASFVQLSPAR